MDYLAHTENLEGKVDFLKDHLLRVATKAEKFAKVFGGDSEAKVAGLLHDLGKFRDEFQSYLRNERESSVDTHHAVYGAAHSYFNTNIASSFAIAGHHSGLHNCRDLESLIFDKKYDSQNRIPSLIGKFNKFIGEIPNKVDSPSFFISNTLTAEFYIRMLFSCLVDADYLDTDEHFTGIIREPLDLKIRYDYLLGRLQEERSHKSKDGLINQTRNQIYELCLEKCNLPQGFFTLTVPTGGGKTLSSMALLYLTLKSGD